MNTPPKADIFLNLVEGRLTGFDDFISQGFEAKLREKEDYQNNEKVQSLFLDDKGNFDKQKFDKTYDTAKDYYDNLAEHDFDVRNISNYIVESRYTEGYNPTKITSNLSLQANPLDQTISMVGFNKLSKPTKTLSEKRQEQNYFVDYETGKKIKTKDEDEPYNWFGRWLSFEEPLVAAKYEEDGEHIDGLSGQKVKHQKGEDKLDEWGNPYFETLSGRDVTGKEFLSFTDTFTDEGTWLNKYDFMDSDGVEKSMIGQTFKTAAMLAPLAIPYVNGAYVAAIGGSQIMNFLAEYGKIADSVINDTERDDQTTFNNIQGFVESYRSGQSDEAKQNPFGFESLTNMASSVFLDIYTQVGIAKLPAKLKAMSNPALLTKSLQQKGYLDKTLDLNKALSSNKVLKEALGVSQYNNLMKVGASASFLYNVGVASKEIADAADSIGMNNKDKAVFTLLGAAGLASIYKFLPFDSWFLNGLGVDDQANLIRQSYRKYMEPMKKVLESNNPVEVKGLFNKIGKEIQDLAKKSVEAKTLIGAGLAESAEESTEVVFAEGMKEMYNSMKDLGYTYDKDKKKKFETFGEEFWTELSLSAVGGAIGGAGFRVLNRVPETEVPEFNSLIAAGLGEEVGNVIKKEHAQGKIMSPKFSTKVVGEKDGRPVWAPAKEGDYTHNDLAKDYLLRQIEVQDFFLRSLGTDNESLTEAKKNVFKELANTNEVMKALYQMGDTKSMGNLLATIAQDAGAFTSIGDDAIGYATRIKQKQKEVRELQQELDSEENDIIRKGLNTTLKTKEKELNDLQKELDDFTKIINNEETDKRDFYLRQALFSTYKPLLKQFGVKTKEDFDSDSEYEKYIFEFDSEGRNKAADMKKAFSNYEKFIKDADFPKTLKGINYEQLGHDQLFHNFLFELQNIDYDVEKIKDIASTNEFIKVIQGQITDTTTKEELENLIVNSINRFFGEDVEIVPKVNLSQVDGIDTTKNLPKELKNAKRGYYYFGKKLVNGLIEGDTTNPFEIDNILLEDLPKDFEDILTKLNNTIKEGGSIEEIKSIVKDLETEHTRLINLKEDPDLAAQIKRYELFDNDVKLDPELEKNYLDFVDKANKLEEEESSFKYKLKDSLTKFEASEDIAKIKRMYKNSGLEEFISNLEEESKKGIEFVDDSGNLTKQVNDRIDELNRNLAYIEAINSYNPLVNASRKLLNISEELKNKEEFVFPEIKIGNIKSNPAFFPSQETLSYKNRLLRIKRILENNKKFQVQNIIKMAPVHFNAQLELLKNAIPQNIYNKVKLLLNATGEVTPDKLSDMYLEMIKLFNYIRDNNIDLKTLKTGDIAGYGYKEKDGKITYEAGLAETLFTLIKSDLDFGVTYMKLLDIITQGNTAPIYSQELAIIDSLVNKQVEELENDPRLDMQNWSFIDAPGGAGKSRVVFPNLVSLFNLDGKTVYFSAPKESQVEVLSDSLSDIHNAQSLGTYYQMFKTLGLNYKNPKRKNEFEEYVEYDGDNVVLEVVNRAFVPKLKLDKINEVIENATILDEYKDSVIILDEATHLDIVNGYILSKVLEKYNIQLKTMGGSEQKAITVKAVHDGKVQNAEIEVNSIIAKFQPSLKLQDTLRNASQYSSETNDSLKRLQERALEQNSNNNKTYKQLDHKIPNRHWEGETGDGYSIFGSIITSDESEFKDTIQKFLKSKKEGETIVFISDAPTLSPTELKNKFGTDKIRVVPTSEVKTELETSDTVQGQEWDYVVVDSSAFNQEVDEFSGNSHVKDFYTFLTRAKKAVTILNPQIDHEGFTITFDEITKDDSSVPALKVVMTPENIDRLREHKLQTLELLKSKLETEGLPTEYETKGLKKKVGKGKPKNSFNKKTSGVTGDTVSGYINFKPVEELERLKAKGENPLLFYRNLIDNLDDPKKVTNLRVEVKENVRGATDNLTTRNMFNGLDYVSPLVISLVGEYEGETYTITTLTSFKNKTDKFTKAELKDLYEIDDSEIPYIKEQLANNIHIRFFDTDNDKVKHDAKLDELKEVSSFQFSRAFYIKNGPYAGQAATVMYSGEDTIITEDDEGNRVEYSFSKEKDTENLTQYLFEKATENIGKKGKDRDDRFELIFLDNEKAKLRDVFEMFDSIEVEGQSLMFVQPNEVNNKKIIERTFFDDFKVPIIRAVVSDEALLKALSFNVSDFEAKIFRKLDTIKKMDLSKASVLNRAIDLLSAHDVATITQKLITLSNNKNNNPKAEALKKAADIILNTERKTESPAQRTTKQFKDSIGDKFSHEVFLISSEENLKLSGISLSLETLFPTSVYNKIINTTPEVKGRGKQKPQPANMEESDLIKAFEAELAAKGLDTKYVKDFKAIIEAIKVDSEDTVAELLSDLLSKDPNVINLVDNFLKNNCS